MIFGFDRFKDNGDPLPNCENFTFLNNGVCNCGNVFLGMFQDININYISNSQREWENLDVDTKSIFDIDENYIFVIDVNCFASSLGYERWPDVYQDKSVFDKIPDKVIKDSQIGKCKILFNYGYEGLGSHHRDTILYKPLLDRLHFILDKYKIEHHNFIYLDSNLKLDKIKSQTNINVIQYEYCAVDWWRFTKQFTSMMYYGDSESSKNMKRWLNTKSVLRSKYYLSFNRLPKPHRVRLITSLDEKKLLDKGHVSFANNIDDWDWRDMVDEDTKISLEKKMPLCIDSDDLSKTKHSYDRFDIKYYLDSYFQIVTGNNFTNFDDQLIFSEKIWKPITNFQPFIYLDDVGALEQLREYGFKTFSPYIDESYDNIYDTDERFEAIMSEIQKLCEKSIQDIHDWYWSIQETLKHNHYHFYENFIPNHKKHLLEQIESIL